MTEWSEGRNALISLGDENIQILKYINGSAFIVKGVYNFCYTAFTNLNAYVLSEPIAFFILTDPYSSIISALVNVIVASITITSIVMDPRIMLSKDYELTSLFTMDLSFTYIPNTIAGV